MGEIFNSRELFNMDEVSRKCWELMAEQWESDTLLKPKLRTYRNFKSEFVVEPYVQSHLPKSIRSIFAQFRTGILPIRLETGRFSNILDEETGLFRKLQSSERLCQICGNNEVEDEKHFLMDCKEYENERKILFDYCTSSFPNFGNLSHDEQFVFLLTYEWKNLI